MTGGSESDRKNPTSKARRWVLRSPGRKPTKKIGGGPRDDDCIAITSDAGEASAEKFDPPAATIRSRSRSPLSRIRNKMPGRSVGVMKHFRRKSPSGSSKTAAAQEQRSPRGRTTASCSIDTTSQDAELARHWGGGGESSAQDALTSPVEDDGKVGVLLSEPYTTATDETKSSHSHCHLSAQQHQTTYNAGCRDNGKLKEGGVPPETAIEHDASRVRTNLGVGGDAIPAVKAGKQPPRIAFIGVFLNGVAVALASYAPFGGVDARTALIKSMLLEPIAVVRPGGCYTVRGSVLAVHAVVDQKQRVYACITAEDVPFSLGLSLLEEVQIEYISTVATLAFSTKENSHNTRCRAQMARSWAKYEGVERALERERETRRLLGEDPLDIESPAGGSRRTYTGAEVTPLQFTPEHQPVLLAASREIFLLEENGGNGLAVDATNSDDSDAAAAARLGKLGHKKTKAALVAAGVTGLVAGLYAARHTISFF